MSFSDWGLGGRGRVGHRPPSLSSPVGEASAEHGPE